MDDGSDKTTDSAADDAPARPSRPTLAPRQTSGARPALPGSSGLRAQVEEESPVIDIPVAEPVAITLPAAPPVPPSTSLPVGAGLAFRQTLIPPMAVLAVGFGGLGIVYLMQPGDAALRTLPAGFAWAALAVAGLAAVGTAALLVSARRR